LELLTKANPKIDKKNSDGVTALWKATLKNDTTSMKILLRNGADPDTPTDGGVTPIFLNCEDGFLVSAGILYEYGANVNFNNNKYMLSPLRHAARSGQLEMVKFLVDHGAIIDAKAEDQATALTAACGKGHLEIVKVLIQKGANINVPDKDGDTPLINACSGGRYEVVKYLLEMGSDKNIKNNKGNIAIEIANEKGFPKIVDLLK